MSTSEILLQERESCIFVLSSEKHSTNDLWAPQELNLSLHDQTWRWGVLTIKNYQLMMMNLMKKSSWPQEMTPKLVNLKTLSMIHMTLLVNPSLLVKSDMRRGTSAVDWWLGRINSFWCFILSRFSPLSTMLNPADQLQQVTMDNIQLNITSSIIQNTLGLRQYVGENKIIQQM